MFMQMRSKRPAGRVPDGLGKYVAFFVVAWTAVGLWGAVVVAVAYHHQSIGRVLDHIFP